ncbi:MAG: GNAT family N-acetyltransferase, partial [Candidatus Omnitrophica bacterium]|nr:GNAT family N-acetyltransferase [Candidatus Omnitrophota bacterium]
YIHPDYRRQGYFRKIFEWVVEQVRQDPDAVGLRLYVDRHNQPALATYEKLGMSRMDYLIYELKYKQDGDS